jgi:hypothetical protein
MRWYFFGCAFGVFRPLHDGRGFALVDFRFADSEPAVQAETKARLPIVPTNWFKR